MTGLDSLDRFVGKTWRATFTGPGGAAVTDVVRWERALNGKAVKSAHSIDDGAYGGETYFLANGDTVEYHYFTTEGFRTQGTVTRDGERLVTLEVVTGNAGGIDQVRGTTTFALDGTYEVVTEYRKDGAWLPGRRAVYSESPGAVVRFRDPR